MKQSKIISYLQLICIQIVLMIQLSYSMKFKATVPYMYPFCFFENLGAYQKKYMKFEAKVPDYQVLIVSNKGKTLYFKENQISHQEEVQPDETGQFTFCLTNKQQNAEELIISVFLEDYTDQQQSQQAIQVGGKNFTKLIESGTNFNFNQTHISAFMGYTRVLKEVLNRLKTDRLNLNTKAEMRFFKHESISIKIIIFASITLAVLIFVSFSQMRYLKYFLHKKKLI